MRYTPKSMSSCTSNPLLPPKNSRVLRPGSRTNITAKLVSRNVKRANICDWLLINHSTNHNNDTHNHIDFEISFVQETDLAAPQMVQIVLVNLHLDCMAFTQCLKNVDH